MHCFGHSLNLAVADTLKEVKPMSNTLDHCLEICKLLKFSARREAIFSKLKSQITPHVPSVRTLCPVRAASLESIRQNYPTLFATWEEADVVKQANVKARITAKMKEFAFLFCLMLAENLLKHCDNLSRTIQSSSMPAVEARRLSELCIRVFQKMRDDEDFDLFWALTQQTQKQLDVNDPILQRQCKRPRRYEDGSASPFFFSDPKAYYRSMYFQCLDAVIAAITDRFH